MATPAQPLAHCIARWIYEQASKILKVLKAFIEMVISYIDAQIAFLRAQLAQWDILARLEEAAWAAFQAIIDAIRNELMSAPEGPLAEFCPEFYEYFLDPARTLFDSAISSLTIYRNRYHDMISYMDEIDRLIAYWTQTKTQLVEAVDIIDDALYMALAREADAVP